MRTPEPVDLNVTAQLLVDEFDLAVKKFRNTTDNEGRERLLYEAVRLADLLRTMGVFPMAFQGLDASAQVGDAA